MSIPIEDCAIPSSAAPRFQMTCSNDDGPVGTLLWDNGVLQFKGKADESAIIFMKHLAEQYRLDLICNDKRYTPAINTNVRLFDLVRFMRSELHEAELITCEEYGWLCGEAPMAKGSGSPSPRRLEDYDRIKARMKLMEKALNEIREMVGGESEDPDRDIARMQDIATDALSENIDQANVCGCRVEELEKDLKEARSLAETYRDNDHDLTLQNSIHNPPAPLLPWEKPADDQA